MPAVRLAFVCSFALLAFASPAHVAKSKLLPAPKQLRGFVLRADEKPSLYKHTFPRTPAFAWRAVAGAKKYEFELSPVLTPNGQSFVSADEAGGIAGPDQAAVPKIDLWDTAWPKGGYYWQVIPIVPTPSRDDPEKLEYREAEVGEDACRGAGAIRFGKRSNAPKLGDRAPYISASRRAAACSPRRERGSRSPAPRSSPGSRSGTPTKDLSVRPASSP